MSEYQGIIQSVVFVGKLSPEMKKFIDEGQRQYDKWERSLSEDLLNLCVPPPSTTKSSPAR